MVRGRKPKPTQFKVITGNPGKRPLNEAEPEPRQGWPDMPAHFEDREYAVQMWEWCCEELDAMNVLSTADAAILEIIALDYALMREAEEMVQQFGIACTTKKDGKVTSVYQSPYLSAANSAKRRLHVMLAEMGLSPTSRTRIKATQPKKSGVATRKRGRA